MRTIFDIVQAFIRRNPDVAAAVWAVSALAMCALCYRSTFDDSAWVLPCTVICFAVTISPVLIVMAEALVEIVRLHRSIREHRSLY